MQFSVLMSVYRKEKPEYLSKAIESIINQTLPPSEIVVVKDGNLTDDLEKILDNFTTQYPDLFKIIPISKQVGLGRALAIGVLNCKYEIIARMDSDDVCHPERFERQIKFLEQNTDVDIVGSWISEFEEDPSHVVSVRKVPVSHEEIYRYAKFRCPINHMTVVFKKQSVLRAGNYLDFPMLEDYYLWIRMLINGAKFANIPESLVYVRTGKSMFNRRRGKTYLMKEIKLHRKMLDIGFITTIEFLRNIIIRIFLRLLPLNLLRFIYRKFARASTKYKIGISKSESKSENE